MPYNRHFGHKYSHFGEDTKGHDVKAFGDTTGKYILWDASADKFYLIGDMDLTGALTLNSTALAATFAEINRACDASTRIVPVTANLALTEALHDGKVMVLNKADGLAITLPAATGSGAKFKLVVLTTFTGAATIKVVGDDIMKGYALLGLDDEGDGSKFFATAADTNTITFAADSTTGGVAGATVELIDIAANTWGVQVVSDAAGTEATPFSATVTP
jgi:hypothetical protein